MTHLEDRLRRSLRSTADTTLIPDPDIDGMSTAAQQEAGCASNRTVGDTPFASFRPRTLSRGRAVLPVLAVAAMVGAVLVGAAAIVRDVGAGTPVDVAGGTPSQATGSAATPDGTHVQLPKGWRWESYRTVQVGVPETWGDGASTGQLSGQWCIAKGRSAALPVVGRPGFSTLALCPRTADGGDPGTMLINAGTFVGFGTSWHALDGTRHEGDRTTVTVNGVSVLIQAPAVLRAKIAATISTFTTDPHGCPATHRVSADPAAPPSPAADVTTLTGVTMVSACKYTLSRSYVPDEGGLISSIRLSGRAAVAAVDGIARTPIGSGPNAPARCGADDSYGEEAVVLLVQADQGPTQIYLRYAGCDHHGFDDASTVRTLTPRSVAPFIAGENTLGSVDMNRNMLAILIPAG